jgi:hypothetical protein
MRVFWRRIACHSLISVFRRGFLFLAGRRNLRPVFPIHAGSDGPASARLHTLPRYAASNSGFSDAMSITKRYFTSLFNILS